MCESDLHSFFLLTVWLCIFLAKNIGAKSTHKMLVKLSTGCHRIKYVIRQCVYGFKIDFGGRMKISLLTTIEASSIFKAAGTITKIFLSLKANHQILKKHC